MTNRQIHEARMERYVEKKVKKIFKVVFIVIFGAIAIAALALLFGYVVMLLWNWLIPAIFGLGIINFWQAVGIVILAKLLFGGFGSGGGRSKGRSKRRFGKRIGARLKERCAENGISEWKLYDQYWEEEGKVAYRAFIDKKKAEEE